MNFNPGFRINYVDVVFSLLVALAGGFIFSFHPLLSFMVVISAFQFFLFCNVFRVQRFLELVWSLVYISLCFGVIIFNCPEWIYWVAWPMVGIIVILIEIRKKSYHGVFWETINPNLEQWFYENNG